MVTLSLAVSSRPAPEIPPTPCLRQRSSGTFPASSHCSRSSLFEIEDEDEREAAIEDEAERWEADAFKLLKTSMREFCGYTGSRLRRFTEHYESQRRELQITGDLGDDTFEITVVMPGEIVGANADSISHREAKWTFSGERFRDRDLELMVSSRVDRDP